MHLSKNTLLQEGKYKIIETLGQGGFGIAYKVLHRPLNKVVCIKEFFYSDFCIRKPNSTVIEIISGSSDKIQLINKIRKKFLKEAQRLASFNHINIVPVMDVFEENNTAYYVMEYLNGGSLEDLLKKGPLSEKNTLRIISQILNGLKTIHRTKLLHLDIKPMNIMLREDDTPVLIDFGISKYIAFANSSTTTSPIGLTKGFAPIEQYGGNLEDFSEATDTYAVCATMYYMLTGHVPPEPLQILKNGLKSITAYNTTSSCMLDDLVKKGLSFSKEDRYLSTVQLIKELNKITNSNIDIDSSDKRKSSIKKIHELNEKLYEYSSIGDYNDGLARVKYKDKYGFIGKAGQEVIECKYDDAFYFSTGFVRVSINGKHGYINTNGEVVIPVKYDYLGYKISDGLVLAQNNNKYGYLNPLGQEVIPFIYEHANDFSEGLASVRFKNKFGFIDITGNIAIPFEYDFAHDFSEGLVIVKKSGVSFYINKKNEDVFRFGAKYVTISDFSCGLAIVGKSKYNWFDPNDETIKYGYINSFGVEVIPCIYDKAEEFDDSGLAYVMIKDGLFSKKEKWGIIYKTGREIIKPRFANSDDAYNAFLNLVKSFRVKNGEIFYLDEKGNILGSYKLDFSTHTDNLISLADFHKDNKQGYIDINGNWVIPPIYDECWDFIDGMALVKSNSRFYVIDKKGQILMK